MNDYRAVTLATSTVLDSVQRQHRVILCPVCAQWSRTLTRSLRRTKARRRDLSTQLAQHLQSHDEGSPLMTPRRLNEARFHAIYQLASSRTTMPHGAGIAPSPSHRRR